MSNYIRTVSPSTEEVIFERPGTSLEEARQIIQKSNDAFKSYKNLPLSTRKEIVQHALQIINAKKETLAAELTIQMGRPIAFAEKEIETMCKRANYLLDICDDSLASIPGKHEDGFRRFVKKEPVGVVFISFAWNFPYLIAVNALVPALLSGNTVILRPSPQTPLVGEQLVDIFKQAGLPCNVLQLVHIGDISTLEQVVQIPDISLVSFTGSTAGGISMREATSRRIVPLNLELGGKDPAYVRADADIQFVAEQIVDGAIFNSGQSCCSVERVYVHADVHDEFVEEVQKVLKSYKLGDPTDKSTTVGPVISGVSKTLIEAHIADAISKGAKDVTPTAENPSFAHRPSKGHYIPPTVLTNVNHSMRVMCEETFGPVIPIMKVSDDDEAVRVMNDSEYGLTASVWTRDIQRAEELIEQIDVGTVFVNRCDYPSPDLTWIGWKNSGLGCTLGPYAFHAFVRLKSFHIKEKQL